jgi:HK97 gp10 family phage protein
MASKVKGLDRLLRQLEALPNSVRATLDDELARGAADLAQAIENAAPISADGSHGRLRGALKRSVGWVRGLAKAVRTNGAFRLASKDLNASGRALNAAGLLFSVFAGNDEAFYARFVEHGTSAAPAGRSKDAKGKARNNKQAHHATRAQPFFFPTIRAMKKPLRSRVVRASNKAAKEVARLR